MSSTSNSRAVPYCPKLFCPPTHNTPPHKDLSVTLERVLPYQAQVVFDIAW
jgi:hypothetical protein